MDEFEMQAWKGEVQLTFFSCHIFEIFDHLSDDLHATVGGDDEADFVAEILHLLDLSETSDIVDVGEFLHNFALVVFVFLHEDSDVGLVESDLPSNEVDQNWI
jgi:hypothetical protein